MVNPFYFDYVEFQKTLTEELLLAFFELARIRAGQNVYCYGLASHTEFEPIKPFLLTEEMLSEHIDETREAQPHLYRGMSRSDIWLYERYSLTIHRDYFLSDYLPESNALIYQGMQSFDGMIISARKELPEEKVEEIIEEHHTKYRRACLDALGELAEKGCFGFGVRRDQSVVLFVLFGNTDPTYPRWDDIVELNPPSVSQRYNTEIEQAQRFYSLIRQNMIRP